MEAELSGKVSVVCSRNFVHSNKNGSHPPCLLGAACNKDVVSCLLCVRKPVGHLFKSSPRSELEDLPLNEQRWLVAACVFQTPQWVVQVASVSKVGLLAGFNPLTRWCLAAGTPFPGVIDQQKESSDEFCGPFCHQKNQQKTKKTNKKSSILLQLIKQTDMHSALKSHFAYP